MINSLHPQLLALLAIGASLAGFVDTLAGGGGLITVPLLLLCGLSPVEALATNKLQGCCGTLAASLTLLRHRQITFGEAKAGAATAFLGGLLGALAVHKLDPTTLDVVIPVTLAAIALYFLLAPRAGDLAGEARLASAPYLGLILPAIGFYDGFFGPGAGSFYAAAGVGLRGLPLLRASAFAKLLNFASNLGAFLLFLAAGKIVWLAGSAMIVGQVAGAYAGSRAMITGGARLIRPVIVIMCFIMIARYLWQKGLIPGGL